MTKLGMVLLVLTFLAFFLIRENNKTGNVFAQTETRDTSILVCLTESAVNASATGRRLIVVASSSGGNARTINRGTDCADALASQLKAGLTLEDVQAHSIGIVYTLIK